MAKKPKQAGKEAAKSKSGALANPKHERFAQELAKGKSQAEAYAEAGYKPSEQHASRLASNGKVSARVAELLDRGAAKAEATAERVLKELARLGFSDIRRAFDDQGRLKPPTEWDDELAAAVASIEVVSRKLPGADDAQEAQGHGGSLKRSRATEIEYVHKIKFWDKNSALEKIAKTLGMFIDRAALELSVEANIEVKNSARERLARKLGALDERIKGAVDQIAAAAGAATVPRESV